MKYLGIYIDYEGALLITIENGQANLKRILSNIDHSRIKGGARSKKPYGPQDNISESKGLYRKQHQTQEYFQMLIPYLHNALSVLLFGHGRAKNEFAALLKKEYKFKNLPISIKNANKLTDNQAIAEVRSFYKLTPHWQL